MINFITPFLCLNINYFTITFLNFFLPRFTTAPSPSNSSLETVAWISVIFSPFTETPPCCILRLASDLDGARSALTSKLIMSILLLR